MFTSHPSSEFFNLDDFVNENISTLREMYEQANAYFKGAYFGDELAMAIATAIAGSVYADAETVEIPVAVDPDEIEAVHKFAADLFVVVSLFDLEAKGCVTHKRDGWVITEAGGRHLSGMAA